MSEAFVLPSSVVTKSDVARLVNEAEWIDNELTAATVRAKAGAGQQQLPTLSGHFGDFVTVNNISLNDGLKRSELIKQLRQLKDTVPIVHMTFATPADPESLRQIADWFRTQVHPQMVIDVGVQPHLVAGVSIRTSNRVFDFSLRSKFTDYPAALRQALEASRG